MVQVALIGVVRVYQINVHRRLMHSLLHTTQPIEYRTEPRRSRMSWYVCSTVSRTELTWLTCSIFRRCTQTTWLMIWSWVPVGLSSKTQRTSLKCKEIALQASKQKTSQKGIKNMLCQGTTLFWTIRHTSSWLSRKMPAAFKAKP